MPSPRAGRCFEGERGEKVEDAYHRGQCLCGCIKILKAAEGRKHQKRWLLLLPMANAVAPSPGAVRQRDGANSQGWYSHQGVTLRGFHFLLLNWDYPQLSVLLQHKTVSWERVCVLTVCPCMSKSVLWCVGFFFCLWHTRWFDGVLVTLFASLVIDSWNEKTSEVLCKYETASGKIRRNVLLT